MGLKREIRMSRGLRPSRWPVVLGTLLSTATLAACQTSTTGPGRVVDGLRYSVASFDVAESFPVQIGITVRIENESTTSQSVTFPDSCVVLMCVAADPCIDGIKSGDETDVDCGGTLCAACDSGLACRLDTDCSLAGTCVSFQCSSCADEMINGYESDVDCGGPTCGSCTPGQICRFDTDCEGRCTNLQCAADSSCTDMMQNGSESDVDCGGGGCPACAVGSGCSTDNDCAGPDTCDGALCVSCTDLAKNGSETDTD